MKNEKFRTVFLYKEYFMEFYDKQSKKVKEKIIWTLRLVETVRQVPEEYFKHLDGTDGLFEIRVQHGRNIFRVFCFFSEGSIVVLTTGFQKKTQKTPRFEIERALKIKLEYENEQ